MRNPSRNTIDAAKLVETHAAHRESFDAEAGFDVLIETTQ
jgi:hypothetical protein